MRVMIELMPGYSRIPTLGLGDRRIAGGKPSGGRTIHSWSADADDIIAAIYAEAVRLNGDDAPEVMAHVIREAIGRETDKPIAVLDAIRGYLP